MTVPSLSVTFTTKVNEALSAIEGRASGRLDAHEITAQAMKDAKSFCGNTLSRFCAIMGSVAGDIALVIGARSGVLLAGGILPAVADFFSASDFRARFEAKGRFEAYMKNIPTQLIVQDNAGLIGAAAILTAMHGMLG